MNEKLYADNAWDRVAYVMCIEDPYEENCNLARRIDAEKSGTVGRVFMREYHRVLRMRDVVTNVQRRQPTHPLADQHTPTPNDTQAHASVAAQRQEEARRQAATITRQAVVAPKPLPDPVIDARNQIEASRLQEGGRRQTHAKEADAYKHRETEIEEVDSMATETLVTTMKTLMATTGTRCKRNVYGEFYSFR